jgi:hypothetical protein
MQDIKPQGTVESDSPWHFVSAERDRADPLDHGQNSPELLPAPFVIKTSLPVRALEVIESTPPTKLEIGRMESSTKRAATPGHLGPR